MERTYIFAQIEMAEKDLRDVAKLASALADAITDGKGDPMGLYLFNLLEIESAAATLRKAIDDPHVRKAIDNLLTEGVITEDDLPADFKVEEVEK